MNDLPNVNDFDSINTRKIHRLTTTPDVLGSIIHSDEWRAYFQLSNNAAYTDLTVNHSIRFVDPTTGVDTQNIENTWMRVKQTKTTAWFFTTLTQYIPTRIYVASRIWR